MDDHFSSFSAVFTEYSSTMSSEQFKNKLRLFDDSCLPDSLRAALLLSAVVADELQANTLLEERTPNTSHHRKGLC
jgi:hypothetical protein